ncbi:MAG TPA: hypothetical protein PLV56_02635 [Synergistales bacterium]|nr:hypothetical protein [Synergistales bacterium]
MPGTGTSGLVVLVPRSDPEIKSILFHELKSVVQGLLFVNGLFQGYGVKGPVKKREHVNMDALVPYIRPSSLNNMSHRTRVVPISVRPLPGRFRSSVSLQKQRDGMGSLIHLCLTDSQISLINDLS